MYTHTQYVYIHVYNIHNVICHVSSKGTLCPRGPSKLPSGRAAICGICKANSKRSRARRHRKCSRGGG